MVYSSIDLSTSSIHKREQLKEHTTTVIAERQLFAEEGQDAVGGFAQANNDCFGISSLPVDILQYIFRLTADSCIGSDDNFALTHVCRYSTLR